MSCSCFQCHNNNAICDNVQGRPKKMAITTWKSIKKGKSWCVLENSAHMLQDRHQTFQIWWKNGLEK